jgi:F-type H+-transporting ATPase subunit gamma
MVAGIAAAAADLLAHHPDLPGALSGRDEILLLLGSERGFCGAFNEAVLTAADSVAQRYSLAEPRLVTVGYRLSSRMRIPLEATAKLDGATVAEEIPAVLGRLMDTLAKAPPGTPPAPVRVTVVHHSADGQNVETTVLDPFAIEAESHGRAPCPPLLHAAPGAVFAELTRHFLWARLQYLLTDSLMAENQQRFAHMDNAIRHVEEEKETLARRRNALRQEEITEEIETILLNAENQPGFWHGQVPPVGDLSF